MHESRKLVAEPHSLETSSFHSSREPSQFKLQRGGMLDRMLNHSALDHAGVTTATITVLELNGTLHLVDVAPQDAQKHSSILEVVIEGDTLQVELRAGELITPELSSSVLTFLESHLADVALEHRLNALLGDYADNEFTTANTNDREEGWIKAIANHAATRQRLRQNYG